MVSSYKVDAYLLTPYFAKQNLHRRQSFLTPYFAKQKFASAAVLSDAVFCEAIFWRQFLFGKQLRSRCLRILEAFSDY